VWQKCRVTSESEYHTTDRFQVVRTGHLESASSLSSLPVLLPTNGVPVPPSGMEYGVGVVSSLVKIYGGVNELLLLRGVRPEPEHLPMVKRVLISTSTVRTYDTTVILRLRRSLE
jgi:hypothetical protein